MRESVTKYYRFKDQYNKTELFKVYASAQLATGAMLEQFSVLVKVVNPNSGNEEAVFDKLQTKYVAWALTQPKQLVELSLDEYTKHRMNIVKMTSAKERF